MRTDSENKVDGIPLVSEPSQSLLNERQMVDYREHRHDLLRWALNLGKKPDRGEGYAHDTVQSRASRIDQFYRWVWTHEDGYTTSVLHDHANQYIREIAYENHSTTHKSNMVKALKMLFKWRHHVHGDDLWDPDISFSTNGGPQNPRDFLTREERTAIREASLEYGTVPSYSNITATERTEWKRHLAQRFQMPMRDVGPSEFKRANGYKIPSLISVSLDAGLRPIEVGRAKVSWVDIGNQVLRIPAEESSKGDEHWVVSLRTQTVEMLRRWLDERQLYEKYNDSDALWLTRESNPYSSQTLRRLMHKLCEIAGISTENRSLSFYTIRHSVGTYMTREEGLAAAAAQLRHTSVQTTMKYDQTPIEDRRKALDRMG